jgi:hypothetical protein
MIAWQDIPRLVELLTHAIAVTVAFIRTRPGRQWFAPTVKPLFSFLFATLIADAVRWAIQAHVLRHACRPFVSTARLLFHVDQFGFIGWNVGLVLLSAYTFSHVRFRRRDVALIVTAWTCAAFALAISYPELRGDRLGQAYMVIHAVGVLIALLFVARAWRARVWFGVSARAVSIIVMGDLATLFGPYIGQPFAYWVTAQAISSIVYMLVAWELRGRLVNQ